MSVFRQLLMYNRYIPVDYITCTGAQYINTGIQWSTAQQLDITANLSATNTNKTETILGVYGGTNYCTPIRIKRDSNNKFVISLLYRTGGWIYTKTSTNTFNAGTFYTMTTSWKTTKFTFKVENTSIDMSQGGTSITNPYSSDTTFSKPFYLFALNNNGSPSEYFYGNLKSMTITIAGSVVMNLTPVYDDILEEYGLYDTISEKFYGSESGTKFNGAAVNYNQ
mgnify:FL=1